MCEMLVDPAALAARTTEIYKKEQNTTKHLSKKDSYLPEDDSKIAGRTCRFAWLNPIIVRPKWWWTPTYSPIGKLPATVVPRLVQPEGYKGDASTEIGWQRGNGECQSKLREATRIPQMVPFILGIYLFDFRVAKFETYPKHTIEWS